MVLRFVRSYYDFFDKKIENWALVVVIISLLIVLVWYFCSNEKTKDYSKVSIIDSKNNQEHNNYIVISWIKYKLIVDNKN